MKNAWMIARVLWARLPHEIQATLTVCAATFMTTTAHAIGEGGCISGSCLKHYAGTAIATASATLYAFYMKPSGTGPKP